MEESGNLGSHQSMTAKVECEIRNAQLVSAFDYEDNSLFGCSFTRDCYCTIVYLKIKGFSLGAMVITLARTVLRCPDVLVQFCIRHR